MPKEEYRRRVDNIFEIHKIIIDKDLNVPDVQKYKDRIVNTKDLATLQMLEAEELKLRNEDKNKNHMAIWKKKRKAKTFLKNLDVDELSDPVKKKLFFKALINLLKE